MKTNYPESFEAAWKEYPRREPDNPKVMAYKAWLARVNEGIPIATLLAATKGYATSCGQRRIIGTDKVLMAATFYGPNERYTAYIPKSPAIAPEIPGNSRKIQETLEDRIDPEIGKALMRDIINKLARAKSLA